MPPKRLVNVFTDTPLDHVLEVEVVDLDNLSLAYTLFGHEDERVLTLMIDGQTYTRSREALRTMFTRLLDDLDKVPAQPKAPDRVRF